MELTNIKGIGTKSLGILNDLNIRSVDDLINYYPYRYEILTPFDLKSDYANERIAINAVVNSQPNVYVFKKNFNRMQFMALHHSQLIKVVIFNRSFLRNYLTIGKEITLVGRYEVKNNTFTCEDIKLKPLVGTSINPIYHVKRGLKNSDLHKFIINALDSNILIDDYIPLEFREKYNFMGKKEALRLIHSPRNTKDIKNASLVFKYEELFNFMFRIACQHNRNIKIRKIPKKFRKTDVEKFIGTFPFELTDSQKEAIQTILEDLKSNKKMNRLILGDVGSGKTIVGFSAMYATFKSGMQSVLMAPTEVLARQHYGGALKIFKDYDLKIALLVGSMSNKEKNTIKEELKTGKIDIVIGTHAIIEENVLFANLGLIIADEQHRFGVRQRERLQNKGEEIDSIYMSATPIPRSYALTLYGDLDVSFLLHKPGGRKEIKTIIKKYSELKDVLKHILEEIKKGRQIYVVASMIDEDDEVDLNSVRDLKNKFDMAYQGKVPIEILHGELKAKEKEKIMESFKNNETKILIATTVIEVGVDVENATVMVIFDADRFGLATLHQLRGRVGRNDWDSYCYLICDKEVDRLKVLEESNDGFYISEKDLELRGEGDLFGEKQSGEKTFKIANLKSDFKILNQAKIDSEDYFKSGAYKNNLLYKKIVEEINLLN